MSTCAETPWRVAAARTTERMALAVRPPRPITLPMSSGATRTVMSVPRWSCDSVTETESGHQRAHARGTPRAPSRLGRLLLGGRIRGVFDRGGRLGLGELPRQRWFPPRRELPRRPVRCPPRESPHRPEPGSPRPLPRGRALRRVPAAPPPRRRPWRQPSSTAPPSGFSVRFRTRSAAEGRSSTNRSHMPIFTMRLRTWLLGCAPTRSQCRARSSSIWISEGPPADGICRCSR